MQDYLMKECVKSQNHHQIHFAFSLKVNEIFNNCSSYVTTSYSNLHGQILIDLKPYKAISIRADFEYAIPNSSNTGILMLCSFIRT